MQNLVKYFNPCPAEPSFTLLLQTVDPDQLAYSLKKPTDLDLHCLLLIYSNNLDQVMWLAEN